MYVIRDAGSKKFYTDNSPKIFTEDVHHAAKYDRIIDAVYTTNLIGWENLEVLQLDYFLIPVDLPELLADAYRDELNDLEEKFKNL